MASGPKEKGCVTYFPQAGKLQIAQLYQKDSEDRRGKTVTLDTDDIALHPEARDLILEALGFKQ